MPNKHQKSNGVGDISIDTDYIFLRTSIRCKNCVSVSAVRYIFIACLGVDI
jgi:hypothetical protein